MQRGQSIFLRLGQEVTIEYIGLRTQSGITEHKSCQHLPWLGCKEESDWLYGSAAGESGWFPKYCCPTASSTSCRPKEEGTWSVLSETYARPVLRGVLNAPRSPPPPLPPPPPPVPSVPEAALQAAWPLKRCLIMLVLT